MGKKIDDLNQIWLLGWSQVSNPSDLPCYYLAPFTDLYAAEGISVCNIALAFIRGQFWSLGIVVACMCVCVCLCVSTLLTGL